MCKHLSLGPRHNLIQRRGTAPTKDRHKTYHLLALGETTGLAVGADLEHLTTRNCLMDAKLPSKLDRDLKT